MSNNSVYLRGQIWTC